MDVTFTKECREILSRLELPEERVISVFNNRTRGMLVPGDPARIYGVSWFDQGQIIFASGTVTASRQEQKRFYIDEVSAHLGLELRQNLPAGRISPELKMEDYCRSLPRILGHPSSATQKSDQWPSTAAGGMAKACRLLGRILMTPCS